MMRNVNERKTKVCVVFILVTALTVTSFYYGYGRIVSTPLVNLEEYSVKAENIYTTNQHKYDVSVAVPENRHFEQCTNVKFVGEKSAKLSDITDTIALNGMKEDEVMEIYWKYINTHETTCSNQKRFGISGDGGKEICLDSIYHPQHPCLVYSFGSNFHFDFEEEVSKHFKCEIHTFDPSQPIADHYIPSILTFHLIGLDGRNTTNKLGWKMLTLSGIRHFLNHTNRVIDILKIDIEGSEWHSLPDMFETGVLKYVKQLSIELHFGRSKPENWLRFWGDVAVKEQLKMIRQLHSEGFRLFNHEYVWYSTMKFQQPHGCITNQNEISLININFR